jgi:hypothetical protein
MYNDKQSCIDAMKELGLPEPPLDFDSIEFTREMQYDTVRSIRGFGGEPQPPARTFGEYDDYDEYVEHTYSDEEYSKLYDEYVKRHSAWVDSGSPAPVRTAYIPRGVEVTLTGKLGSMTYEYMLCGSDWVETSVGC